MTRIIDQNRLSDLLSSTPDEIILQTITYSDTNGNLYRFVSNMEDITVNGNVYKAIPFQIILPKESYNSYTNKASLSFDNISQDLTTYLRQNARGATIDLGLVVKDTAGNFSFIYGPVSFDVLSVSYRLGLLSLELGFRSININSAFIRHKLDTTIAPGIWLDNKL